MRLPIKKLCLTAFLLAALSMPTAAYAQGHAPTLHQVVAGVSEYAPGTQPNLRWAHKDALDVAAFWHQHGPKMFGKVEGEALINKYATRKNILDRLDRVIDEAKSGDWAVIFLAGHGGPKGFEWCFCTHDGYISAGELQKRIAKLADKKVTIILIVDSCFAGDLAVPATQAIVLAGCGGGQFSGESDGVQNGVFTRALLDGLQGRADTNNDGRVTLAEVRAYVNQQAPSFGGQQTPIFSVPGHVDEHLPLIHSGRKSGDVTKTPPSDRTR